MDCSEAVYSNDYYDIIVSSLDTLAGIENICQQDISNQYRIYYVNREEVPPLSVGTYKYVNIPKCFTILDQVSLEVSGITKVQTQKNLELKGSGILMGFLDTGIQFENPAFRNTDGSSRIVAVWDQSRNSEKHPDGFIYGTEYTKQELDEALTRENPRDYVPLTDENGHGTQLAAIAVGSEDAGQDFIGVAPYADIAVVKLKPAKEYLREFYYIREGAVAFQENDIFTAIDYLNQLAERRGEPLVLCIGLGTNQGNHSDGGRLTTYLDNFAAKYRRGVCIAAGNEANARHHFYGSISEDTSEKVEINVTEDLQGFIVELWGRAFELFAISVMSPTGEVMPRVPVWNGQQQKQRFLLENTEVLVDYQLGGVRSREQLIHIDFENPTAGLWVIEVYPYRIADGNFHMYLPISEFLQKEVFFIRSNPDNTLTVPSAAELPMAVGGYNAYTEGVWIDSGRGFATDGNIKPDFVAPAVDVFTQNQFGRYERITGTSAAAAIAAGASALMMEWNLSYMDNSTVNSVELKNQLINGTRQKANQLFPNREEGFGRLDVYQSILNMRNL